MKKNSTVKFNLKESFNKLLNHAITVQLLYFYLIKNECS